MLYFFTSFVSFTGFYTENEPNQVERLSITFTVNRKRHVMTTWQFPRYFWRLPFAFYRYQREMRNFQDTFMNDILMPYNNTKESTFYSIFCFDAKLPYFFFDVKQMSLDNILKLPERMKKHYAPWALIRSFLNFNKSSSFVPYRSVTVKGGWFQEVSKIIFKRLSQDKTLSG